MLQYMDESKYIHQYDAESKYSKSHNNNDNNNNKKSNATTRTCI